MTLPDRLETTLAALLEWVGRWALRLSAFLSKAGFVAAVAATAIILALQPWSGATWRVVLAVVAAIPPLLVLGYAWLLRRAAAAAPEVPRTVRRELGELTAGLMASDRRSPREAWQALTSLRTIAKGAAGLRGVVEVPPSVLAVASPPLVLAVLAGLVASVLLIPLGLVAATVLAL